MNPEKSTPTQITHRYKQVCRKFVIPAGKRVSSAMDGKLKYFHVAWIPAIHAGMTSFNTLVYNNEVRA